MNGASLVTAGNFFSCFTVLSNVLLVITFAAQAVRPALAENDRFLTFGGRYDEPSWCHSDTMT